MADTKLTAAFKGSGDLAKTLETIEDAAEDVANAFDDTADSALGLGEGLEAAADAAEDLIDYLEELPELSLETAGGLRAAANAADEAADEFSEATPPTAGLVAILGQMPETSLEAVAANLGLAESIDEVGDEADESTEELEEYAGVLGVLTGMQLGTLVPGIDMPDIGKPSLPNLGSFSPGVDSPSMPNIGGSDSDTFDIAMSMPDMPDIGGGLKELGGALAQIAGIAPQIAGLGKLAGMVGRLAGMSSLAAGSLGALAGGIAALGVVGTVIGSVIALTGAIGGLATAAGGLGVAFAGIFGSALYEKGQKIAEQSKEIESAWQGAQKYLASFEDELGQALQPLMQLDTSGILEGTIDSVLQSTRDYATMVKRLFPDLQGAFQKIKGTWDATSPEIFAQLEKTVRALLPMITGFVQWLIKSAPEAIAFFRKMGTKLLPDLADMFDALWGLIKPFIKPGAMFGQAVIDTITLLAEVLTPLAQIIAYSLIGPLKVLNAVLGPVTDYIKALSDATSDFLRTLKNWSLAIFKAIANLDADMLVALHRNLILKILEGITNAVISGLEGLYGFVMDLIMKIPGASEALAAANAVRKARGKNPIPKELDMKPADFSDAMADLYPKTPGKQTSPIPETKQGSVVNNYVTNDTTINAESNSGGPSSAREIARIVRRAIREERTTGRQQNYPHA